ncbi:MAG: hypothetical protein WC759_05530, partial [Candidatus Micrarchaeia archaeon]
NPADGALPPDEMLDVEACFRPVAQRYGREMFALVMNAGMAGQAAAVLVEQVGKHHSRGGMHALGVLTQSFNQVSSAYCKMKGWTEGDLVQCDRDLQLAFAGKIQVPGQALILNG